MRRSWRPARGMGIRDLGPGIEFNLVTTLFEHLTDGVAFLDPNLVIRAANRDYAQQERRPLAEILGRTAEEVTPGWTEQYEPIHRQVRETGCPFRSDAHPFSFREQPERGLTYWQSTVCPVHEPDGEFCGYLTMRREITQHIREAAKCTPQAQPPGGP